MSDPVVETATETDTPPVSTETATQPTQPKKQRRKKLSLAILDTFKTAQIQNGLRREDYARYRQYCCRRLTRLRHSVNLYHGKGRYHSKSIEPGMVQSERHLLIVLMNAERAWAYAMGRKQEEDNPRARYHVHRRLKKAVFWSSKLVNLCTVTADNRTILEAEAYHNYIVGTYQFEMENWTKSLEHFQASKLIYDKLSSVSNVDAKELYSQRIKEIDPSIRFCNYKLGITSSKDDLMDLRVESTLGSNFGILQSKIDEVLAEKRQVQSLKELQWKGETIPIKYDKVVDLLGKAQEIGYEIDKVADLNEKLPLYDNLFITYNDAVQFVKAEISKISNNKETSSKSVNLLRQLKLLSDYILYEKLSRTVFRNLVLVRSAEQKLERGERGARADDLVKLYENLVTNVTDLLNMDNEEDQGKENGGRTLLFRGWRCYYMATVNVRQGKYPESMGLLERAIAHANESLGYFQGCKKSQSDNVDDVKKLLEKIRVKKIWIKGSYALNNGKQAGKTVATDESKDLGGFSLLDSLDDVKAGERVLKEKSIVDFPPNFTPMPGKPVLFDLALSEMKFPDLESRKTVVKQGFFSSLWGYGKK